MDLDLSDAQRAFRDEVRAWLAANVPSARLAPSSTPEGLESHRAWERRLHAAGYAAIHWPAAYGGRDADPLMQAIFSEEYARAQAPGRINVLGLGLAGPTLMQFGSAEQQRRWLPGILSCDDIWCQGFSEPEAGSDLAGLRTTGDIDGDEMVVNGQKTWTSLGRYADWMFALVRTDRDAAARGRRHDGITFVMIDMHSAGVDVRPIVQLNGDAGFAEVFLSDVRVPLTNVVGTCGDGWRIAMATLGFERGTGLGSHVRFSRDVTALVALVKAVGLGDDPLVRDQVARHYAETEVYRHHTYRMLTALADGRAIGPDASLTKLYWSEMEARVYDTGMRVMGEAAELTPAAEDAVDRDRWQAKYWYARAAAIYAGTSEIQRNIIAERVLGLPREPRA